MFRVPSVCSVVGLFPPPQFRTRLTTDHTESTESREKNLEDVASWHKIVFLTVQKGFFKEPYIIIVKSLLY